MLEAGPFPGCDLDRMRGDDLEEGLFSGGWVARRTSLISRVIFARFANRTTPATLLGQGEGISRPGPGACSCGDRCAGRGPCGFRLCGVCSNCNAARAGACDSPPLNCSRQALEPGSWWSGPPSP